MVGRRRSSRAITFLTLLVVIVVSACGLVSDTRSVDTRLTPPRLTGTVIAAAGDIACEPGPPVTPTTCQQQATSDLLVQRPLSAVLTLGDEQYVIGRLKNFRLMYGSTWGRVLSITRPSPGNHEYKSGGDGFYQYFGAAAGDPKRPYYSFDLGAWHIIALNSECSFAGGCQQGSPQERWLRDDLREHPSLCTLAYWHRPRFSSGGHGNSLKYDRFWRDLHAAGVDVVLNGHDHDYERFAPQSPDAEPDPNGIREFVVGTGGKNLQPLHTPRPNSEVRGSSFGVLEMQLDPAGYSWEFVPIAGSTFTDSGTTSCH